MYHIDYQYLYPEKAKDLKQWYDEPFPERNDLKVWCGTNATVMPLRHTGGPGTIQGECGVFDCDHNYVPLSSVPQRVLPCSFPESDKIIYKDEKVVFCGYFVPHWGHFLIEAVNRLWYFLENDPTIDKYVFCLDYHEEREVRGNYLEFFQLLKIWDKLEFVNQTTTYREVLVPEMAYQCRNYYSPKYIAIFDTIAENVVPNPSWKPLEKFYLSRGQLTGGNALDFGSEVIDSLFQNNGYTILYPEKVPLSQMIYYIRNAKTIASLSGSMPHNILFAKNGQEFDIMERRIVNDDNQICVNQMRQLQAAHIECHYSIYPVCNFGPYLMAYTDCMKRYAEDHGFLPPDKKYCSDAFELQCFKKYMAAYQDLYNYGWYMEDWFIPHTAALWEGHQIAIAHFSDYLQRRRPFLWHHYFEFHYFKQFIKRILKRLILFLNKID